MVDHNGTFYHLNPDLVFYVNQIVLCRVCAENPTTKDQQRIAAGNNSGHLGNLKPLNGTTRNACVPVWLYNIDLQIQANHSTNNCIAFPMNGPVECLKNLPCVDEKYCPQVTFLGPRDEWMEKACKYKYFYKMDTEIFYNWLRVWVEDMFFRIGTSSVYCVTVALTTAYLACMFILYNKFGVGIPRASPSSRHP